MLVLKLCLVTGLSLLVWGEHLFQSGSVSFKRPGWKTVRNRTYLNLRAVDQHNFPGATDIKIRTFEMHLFEGAVKNLAALEVLRFKNCSIYDIPARTFLNLPRIKTVHLQDNRIREIRKDVFNFLPIEELWLQRNAITTIESDAFNGMSKLVEIKLNENLLTTWDSNWFYKTPHLTRIFFGRNRIRKLPKRAFANIKTSHKINGTELVDTSIYLSGNNISYIHPDAFRGIDSLYELRLRRNRIQSIDDVFSHFTELHILILERNKLENVNKKTFAGLGEMEKLNLARNNLTCLPFEIVEIVGSVNVTGNPDMDCSCLRNLKDELKDKNLERTVYHDDKCNK